MTGAAVQPLFSWSQFLLALTIVFVVSVAISLLVHRRERRERRCDDCANGVRHSHSIGGDTEQE